jgi:hypothetical protein
MDADEAIAKFNRFRLKVERDLEKLEGRNDPEFLE